MKYKLIVWGIGREFYNIYPYIQHEAIKYNISLGIGVDHKTPYCKYLSKIITPSDINKETYDYVVVTSSNYYFDIVREARNLGIPESKIINGIIFLNQDFDFKYYIDNGWINDNFSDSISESSCEDRERIYKRKNLTLKLGRKSYIGKTIIEDGGNKDIMHIIIGNYSCISWDCRFEMGLNLDHDYNRVTNYGYTHLFDKCDITLEKKQSLIIGSDVWIGRGSCLKSGIKIGNGSVIASNSVVVKDVPDYAIVGGNPAEMIKNRFDDDMINAFLRIKWWEWPSEKINEAKYLFDNPYKFIQHYE